MEHAYVHRYETILSGADDQQHNPRPSAYIANDARIRSASNQLVAGQLLVIEFLHLVSHSIDNIYDAEHGYVGSDEEGDDDIQAPPPPPPPVADELPLPAPAEPLVRRGRRVRRPPRRIAGDPTQGILESKQLYFGLCVASQN